VLDPVPVNLPEWVSDADASSLHNARRTSTACKAEIATYGADSVGFASEDLRTANSVCSQSSDCVRHAWKWDYTRCDGNCKVYGWTLSTALTTRALTWLAKASRAIRVPRMSR
jgi:hypothetical protein